MEKKRVQKQSERRKESHVKEWIDNGTNKVVRGIEKMGREIEEMIIRWAKACM